MGIFKKIQIKSGWLERLYIILAAVAFTSKINDFVIPGIVRYACAGIIVAISVLIFLVKLRGHVRQDNKDLIFLIKSHLLPPIVIHLYTIIMILAHVMDARFLSTNISAYLPVILAISAFYLFKDKALKYCLYAIILSWGVSVVCAILANGIGTVFYAISQAYTGDETPIAGVGFNYFEIHDLVLTVGLITVSMIFEKIFNKDSSEKYFDKSTALFLIVIMVLGMKRISVVAIAIVVIVALIIKKLSNKAQKIFSYIMGVGLVLFGLFYVAVLFSGNVFYDFMDSTGIDLMGRNYYYKTITKGEEFSISYLGKGRNSVPKILSQDYSYLKVGAVHNDLLKMYIENGFLIYFLWLLYYAIWLPRKYGKTYGLKIQILYAMLIAYTFILYATDNVENYFIYQTFLTLIPMSFASRMKQISSKKEKRISNTR